jgi:glycosyltransferase involved in cell wall biosynthesis
MAEPLVSVIMPAYNAEKYLRQSIHSLLEQTFANWELLVTNDGSIDSTGEILHSFADPRIKVFHQENKGVSAARNTALANMQGKYFTFLDADDTLPPDSLKLRTDFAEKNEELDMIGGTVCFFKDNGEKKIWHPAFKGDPLQAFIRIDERAFCNPSLFIRRKPSISYQFKEGMTHVEDLLFFATLASQATHRYGFIDELVYNYRVSGNSAMKNLEGLEKGYWIFFDNVKHFRNAEPKNIRYLKWRIIRIMILSYLAGGQFMNALRVLPKTITK